ncbi:MAG: hypothetical protein Alpg2KO_00610 [Alphaproteobacteria bacterium]
MSNLSRRDVEDIATKAALAAVNELIERMGYDPEESAEFRRLGDDMRALSGWRKQSQRVGSAVLVALFTTMTGGVGLAIWHGIKALMTKTPGP